MFLLLESYNNNNKCIFVSAHYKIQTEFHVEFTKTVVLWDKTDCNSAKLVL